MERLWKELRTNWKRDESRCVWTTCDNRVGPQTIRSNQQQASKRSTKKTVKNGAFNIKVWLQITYKKGSDIIIVDALSRVPVVDDNFQFNFSEVNLLEFLAVSEQTRDRLVSATKGWRYETIEEMKEAVTKVLDTLTQEDFYGAFQKLLEEYSKCIAAGGD